MDVSKLKVAELRKELQSRGLDTKGNKPVLVERLKEAIAKEEAEEEEEEESENEEESSSASEGENSLTYETAESTNNTIREAEPEPTIQSEERDFSVITSTASVHNNLSDDVDSQPAPIPDEKPITESEPSFETSPPHNQVIPEEISNETSIQQDTELSQPIEESSSEQVEAPQVHSPPQEPVADTNESESFENKLEEYSPQPEEHTEREAEKIERMDFDEPPQEVIEPEPISNGDLTAQREYEEAEKTLPYQDAIDNAQSPADNQSQLEPMEESEKNVEYDRVDQTQENDSVVDDSGHIYEHNEKSLPFTEENEKLPVTEETEKMETETATIEGTEQESESKNDKVGEAEENENLWNSDDECNDQAPVPEPPPETIPEEPRKRVRKSRFDQPEERKRKHSASPTGDGFQSGGYYEAPAKIPKQDDEPSYDQDSVLLSWYDSDLNLVISKENFVGAVPLCEQGFMYMWAGARSTYGFNSGKVYYDVKLTEKCTVNVYDDFEIYSFRLGWSVAYSSLQLGEAALSYGFDSSGKKCTDDKFEEYGKTFSVDDVIGCLLDFESNEENILITFAINGEKQDVAFEVPKSSLEDKALFPHILSKNIRFEVNFGDRIESWNADESFKEEFEWAAKVPLEQRIQGPKKPEEKTECEVIMMCGLPCSGKTTWVKNHVESHPEKMYNVIGIEAVLNRMKVITEPIQNHYKDAPDILVEKCTRCMNRLIDLASVRWRNYILDQPNVVATVQRRKMRNFEGYTRIAIVIIPSEEEYVRMLEKWNDNTLRDTSISLLELKDNFKLPEEGELFNNVSFVGVNKEEAEEIVKKYNKEGRDARARDERPYGRGFGGRDHGDRMQSYGRPPMGGYRQRWMDRGPPMGRGGWAPRGGMDRGPPGFRDRRNWRDRSPDDDRDGNFRSGRYQQRGMPGGRYGSGGPMMGDNRSWGRGRDRDRMAPRMGGGPPGPNPLLGSMMGKPMMGYSSDRKGRYGSDDGKRRDDDSDDHDRSRVNPPGVDDEVEESFDDGSGGEDDRKRRSRFSDSDRKDQGYRGRGGFQGRGGSSGRGGRGGNGRPPFPPGKGPRGGGYGNRGRGPEGNSDYYGRGGGGGPPRRDNRDRNQMGPRQGSSRFDKRDSGGKNDGNSQVSQPPPGWGMYGQGGWNQSAANYQNWAQYQQAGYSAQQMQQYWSQMQQQQQSQGQQSQQSQQQSGQSSKNATSGSSSNAPSTSTTTSQSASSNSSSQQSGTGGYNTQGYNTAGYGAQGYDANAYAQYCAQYYSQLAQQGWTTQNAWAAYGYNYGAMAASAGGVGGLPSTSVPPPSVTGGGSGSSTGGSGNQSSAVTSASNK